MSQTKGSNREEQYVPHSWSWSDLWQLFFQVWNTCLKLRREAVLHCLTCGNFKRYPLHHILAVLYWKYLKVTSRRAKHGTWSKQKRHGGVKRKDPIVKKSTCHIHERDLTCRNCSVKFEIPIENYDEKLFSIVCSGEISEDIYCDIFQRYCAGII